jgi:hypothetical protein
MVWPAQTPKRNIQRNMQKQTTPIPTIPQILSSNLIRFFFFFLAEAIRYQPLAVYGFSPYMLSGAVSPTDSRPFRNTIRNPSASQSRALESSASSEITRCLL